MAAAPIFVGTPKVGEAQIATANINLDGTGTLGTVLTAGANGSRIDRIRIKAVGTTTAGMVRLFIDTGASVRLFKEVPVSAIVASGTVEAFEAEIEFPDGLILPTGHFIKASTHNAEAFNVIAEGGDF